MKDTRIEEYKIIALLMEFGQNHKDPYHCIHMNITKNLVTNIITNIVVQDDTRFKLTAKDGDTIINDWEQNGKKEILISSHQNVHQDENVYNILGDENKNDFCQMYIDNFELISYKDGKLQAPEFDKCIEIDKDNGKVEFKFGHTDILTYALAFGIHFVKKDEVKNLIRVMSSTVNI
ncbi:MAG: hypothetical protein L3I99_08295 [Sulfurimonas sp.]|nr:hypothetical protein [Sulfurimonas sp.]